MFRPEKGLYFVDSHHWGRPRPVEAEMDMATLVCLNETAVFFDQEHVWLILGWSRDDDWLYCYDATEMGLDRESLRWVGEGYFADRNRVYFLDSEHFAPVADADPATLTTLPLPEYGDYHRNTWRCFARDQKRLYCNGKTISGKPDDVRLTNHEDYFVLGGELFYLLLPLPRQGDSSGCRIPEGREFRLLAERWGTDGVNLYLRLDKGNSSSGEWSTVTVIDGADMSSFQVLGEHYAKDARQVWRSCDGKPLGKVNAASFALLPDHDCGLPGGLASDGRSVFYAGQGLKNTDSANFCHLGHGYFSDGQRHWWLGAERPTSLPDLDPASFRIADLDGMTRATDRISPWDGKLRNTVFDAEMLEYWRPYFQAHPELRDYWWHRANA